MAMESFRALIVDPVSGSRMRLRQAASACTSFAAVTQAADLVEARRFIDIHPAYDLVFFSRIEEATIGKFIDDLKRTNKGQDIAFIKVLERADYSGQNLAMSMLGGADGFLIEPFSVDSLRDTTVLAAKIKKERAIQREQSAVKLLVRELVAQVEVLWQIKGSGSEARISQKNFADMCSVLPTLSDDLRAYYYQCAIEAFEAAPLAKSTRPIYKGASKRIKQRQEQKLNREVMGHHASQIAAKKTAS